MKNEHEILSHLLPNIYQHINAMVRKATKEAIEQVLSTKSFKDPGTTDDFLSAEQAATFLKLKLNTIYAKAEKGELPFYRSGKRKLLFSKTELTQYIEKRKVRSADELQDEIDSYKRRNG